MAYVTVLARKSVSESCGSSFHSSTAGHCLHCQCLRLILPIALLDYPTGLCDGCLLFVEGLTLLASWWAIHSSDGSVKLELHLVRLCLAVTKS